jgi:hypothetical protein
MEPCEVLEDATRQQGLSSSGSSPAPTLGLGGVLCGQCSSVVKLYQNGFGPRTGPLGQICISQGSPEKEDQWKEYETCGAGRPTVQPQCQVSALTVTSHTH